MDAQSNKDLIRAILGEIVQGSAETLFSSISDEIVWEIPNPDNKLPLKEVYKGREGTEELFSSLGELSEVIEFDPQEFIAEGDTVVVIVHEKSRSKSTGEHFEQDMAQVWTVQDGKITRCRLFEDTYSAVRVFGK